MENQYFNKNLIFSQKFQEFDLILKYLEKVESSDKLLIQEAERQTAELLKERGEDINGLLVLALINLLYGNRQRSVSILGHIWDLGGEFTFHANLAYVDLLIDLGLFEMAAMLLKPKFADIEDSVADFHDVMMKFAIATGNLSLIKRILVYAGQPKFEKLRNFIVVYEEVDYGEHFKNIQKIAHEFFKKEIYAYDYILYDDRGFTDLEIVIYLGKETTNYDAAFNGLENSLDNYFTDKGVKRIHNLGFVLKDIKDRPSLEQSL
ncbi:MAG: hypothetical protein ACK5N8_03535 [Alphaproteobacteria bacterium]